MDQRLAKILQLASLAMLAWFAYSWLTKLHWLLGAALCVFAVANAATAWMLREHKSMVRSAIRVGLVRRYVNFVCRCTGDQRPSDTSANSSGSGLLLRSRLDFDVADERAREVVRGHDEVIHRMLNRIHENLTLRKRQRNGSYQGPLASFLVVGPDGVGKRFLSRELAKLLYRDGSFDVFECDQISASQLIGMRGTPGELESVRRDAHRILLFEHVDRAPPEMVRLFMRLLTGGQLRLSGSENHVSLANTVVVFTTTLAMDSLSEAATRPSGAAAWDQKAIDLIANATRIDRRLLSTVTELVYCAPPNDRVKSEVIALLLAEECGVHRTELNHVDPEIIATQVLQLEESQGFAGAPPLVKKLLRKPLVAATVGEHGSLSLRVRSSSL